MMSGCGILTNGKGTRREYGEYNLEELAKEGDTIGKPANVSFWVASSPITSTHFVSE